MDELGGGVDPELLALELGIAEIVNAGVAFGEKDLCTDRIHLLFSTHSPLDHSISLPVPFVPGHSTLASHESTNEQPHLQRSCQRHVLQISAASSPFRSLSHFAVGPILGAERIFFNLYTPCQAL